MCPHALKIKELTECHELRSNRNSEDDQVQDLDHSEVIISTVRNQYGTNIEYESFGEIDKSASNTISATFDKSAPHSCCQSLIDGFVELVLESGLESHSADTTNV